MVAKPDYATPCVRMHRNLIFFSNQLPSILFFEHRREKRIIAGRSRFLTGLSAWFGMTKGLFASLAKCGELDQVIFRYGLQRLPGFAPGRDSADEHERVEPLFPQ